jgi:ribosomal protein S18 acetylase RimI-like enzyme
MIRKYKPTDRKKIIHLYRDALYLEPTLSCYKDKHYQAYVYEKNGEILGVIILEQDYLNLSIFNLYVDVDRRGESIGQSLVKFAEKLASRKKMDGIRVSTSVDNEQAQKFYLKLGFEDVGKVKNYSQRGQTDFIFWKKA